MSPAPADSGPRSPGRAALARNARLYPLFAAATSTLPWLPIFFLFFNERVGFDETLTLGAVYYIAVVVLEVPSGYLSDRVGRRPTLVLACLFLLAAYLGFFFATEVAALVVCQVLLAGGIAFQSGSDSALLHDSLATLGRRDDYERAEARARVASMTALAVSCLVGGLLGSVALVWPYALAAAAALVSLWLALAFVEPPPDGHGALGGDGAAAGGARRGDLAAVDDVGAHGLSPGELDEADAVDADAPPRGELDEADAVDAGAPSSGEIANLDAAEAAVETGGDRGEDGAVDDTGPDAASRGESGGTSVAAVTAAASRPDPSGEPEAVPHPPRGSETLARCLADPLLRWLLAWHVLAFALAHLPYEFQQPWIRLLGESGSELGRWLAAEDRAPIVSGVVTALSMTGGVVGALLSVALSARLGLARLLLLANVVQLLIVAGLAAALHPLLLVPLFGRGLAMAMTHAPVMAAIAPRVASARRATWLSVQSLAGRLGFSLVLFALAGAVGETLDWMTLSRVLLVCTLLGATLAVTLWWVGPHRGRTSRAALQ